jgi:hypothetical protein
MFVPFNNGSGGYSIGKSLRLRSSDSAYLSRVFGTPQDSNKFTVSAFVKRSRTGTYDIIYGSNTGTNAFVLMGISSTDQLIFWIRNSSSVDLVRLTSNAVIRDPAAHYHLLFVYDSNNSTASERVRIYKNGERITSFANETYPSLGLVPSGNFPTDPQIGRGNTNSSTMNYSELYLSEINFIDGQALDPSYFGKTDSVTGSWVPKKYAGTYGTNGFYLDFKDGTSLTTLGADASGNGNNWTLNNVSLIAGATYDWMDDTPTNNFAVLNSLVTFGGGTLSNGNLQVVSGTTAVLTKPSTIPIPSGKWYWEVTPTSALAAGAQSFIGIIRANYSLSDAVLGSNSSGFSYVNTGEKGNGGFEGYGATYTTNDVIGVALDLDNGTITFYKNGVSQGVAFSDIPPREYLAAVSDGSTGATTLTWVYNFGQRPFAFTPPSGFKTLSTKNLPVPTIKNGRKYFKAYSRTGTGAANNITGIGFQPDLVWIKNRAAGSNHLMDSSRGASLVLFSDSTAAEASRPLSLTSFNSDGYSLGTGADGNVNTNANNYIDWLWKESVTSGFDAVPYTGTGVTRTIPHGLGVAPSLMIFKRRDGTGNWMTYHSGNGGLPATQALYLNLTNASAATSTPFNNTPPTETEFTLGTSTDVNTNGAAYIAYLFADVAGFSRMGSYVGTGSADGPFIYCGFKPRYVLVKLVSAVGSWTIFDTARDVYNPVQTQIYTNSAGAEGSSGGIFDCVSNGFKSRSTTVNTSGATYIYWAIGDPFKYANAR